MKKLSITVILCLSGSILFAQNNQSIVTQTGIDQFAEVIQQGLENQVAVDQISEQPQAAWIFQSGEMEDETTGGELNQAVVDQTYSGSGNQSFLYQYGSFNKSFQKQDGNGNQFNLGENFPENISGIESLPADAVPNQDGDYHELSQIAVGNFNQSWMYQAGRKHTASQDIEGNYNEVWTSQSGNTQTAEIVIYGNGNGSHYLEHEEGKFPHSDDEEHEDGGGSSGEHGMKGTSGGEGDGGRPDVIPPPHDEDHVFVPSVSVAIKQMGRGSRAEMYIEGNDNKAVIIQRGGSGGNDQEVSSLSGGCKYPETGGGHFVDQDIYGDWNRIFADQRGRSHHIDEFISGNDNLAVLMQKGNGSTSTLTVFGDSNEVGVDQKGKGNWSDVDIDGNLNGNFLPEDEFGVMIVQEGRGNSSDVDILGNSNSVGVHQGGGGISMISLNGNFNSATVNQATLDEH